jgi:hypothetical protein
MALEPGEAGGIAFFAPFEESLECLVHSVQGILQHLSIDVFVLRTKLFDLWQMGRLISERDADLTHPIGFFAFLKGSIVEFPIAVERELESFTLLTRWVYSVFKSFLHSSHSFLEDEYIISHMSINKYSSYKTNK